MEFRLHAVATHRNSESSAAGKFIVFHHILNERLWTQIYAIPGRASLLREFERHFIMRFDCVAILK